jgi:hypothetical protein
MKVLWFHRMPYPALPDDFAERHRSVWVDVERHQNALAPFLEDRTIT